MKKWRTISKKLFVFSLLFILVSGTFSLPAFAESITLTESGGWSESAYIKWKPVDNAVSYNVYVKPASAGDSSYTQIDDMLIREYPSYWRADAVGLTAGQYIMKVEAILSNGSKESAASDALFVSAHDRTGFAFSSDSTFGSGSGAYEENGTLKDGAQVIYITPDTAKTVTLDVIVNKSGKLQTATGIGEILSLRQKGYDETPLAIRFIGQTSKNDMSGQLNSNGYLQVKGKSSYAEMNMTLEGIGEDATAYGWGILVRNCGNVEIRNLGIMLFPDDGISLDTNNCNVWIHNNDIFYGTAGSDADQAKGDGSADIKKSSTYVTFSYNHFWDSGKSSLCGLSETKDFFVTYHHNWFDHSDSRHPRIRLGSIHIYNNYYDGNAKYGVGITSGGSAFVESNYFRSCKYPMMSSLQGTDALGKGTFSGEDGGIIKAFDNKIENAASLIYANSDNGTTDGDPTSFDAYLASKRNETVPGSYKTLSGNTVYNNFDTLKDIGVSASDVDDVDAVVQVVTSRSGRMNKGDFTWEFDNSVDDTSYSVNSALMAKIKSYKSELVSIGSSNTLTKDLSIRE
ncbi:polysaccharide lyase family 1 protein [Lacrimispora sp.]|uniref:pectate lyase family protein n=1 Tax=Lacrimispora sp. TaxID=2719234 RepID=UPI003994E656